MRHSVAFAITLVLLISGCVENETPRTEELYGGPKNMVYNYTVWGASGSVSLVVYKGLNDHLANISRLVYCRPNCPSNESIQQRYLDEEYQNPQLDKLLAAIRAKGRTRQEQVFIAISLVQNIPYDESAYEVGQSRDRYPYQVLYDGSAVCGEKVRLLAYLIKGLNYSTSMLYYPKEKHASLGIRCPEKYSHKNTGYCFIETTTAAIPTYDTGDYPGTGRIVSSPQVLELSDGDTFEDMSEQWDDAREWQRIEELISKNNRVLEQDDYDKWKALKAKYGITNV
jgi:hypothetical protein